jgi:Xaa-Pro aminopeptidase
MPRIRIPKDEFAERVRRVQQKMEDNDFDAIITFGHASEPQYVRYFSDFLMSFETAGIAIPAEGKASLLVGPESQERAKMHDVLGSVKRMMAFREPAAPKYEDDKFDTFEDILAEYNSIVPLRKIGIAGWTLIPMDIYEEIRQALRIVAPGAELVSANEIIDSVRAQKSEAELACIRRAAQISRKVMEHLLENLHVGMTGEQIKGLALSKMFEEGAEGEAFSMWMTRQEETQFAISIPSKAKLQAGDLVQLQVGARYEGYASALGRAVVMGKASESDKELIGSCIKAKIATEKALEIGYGSNASVIAKAHRD